MARREFSRAVKVEIVKRATRDGVVYCEECGCIAKKWDIDHTNPDGLETDKSRKLTAEDGKLLCSGSRDTCHGRKTAEKDIPAIAEAKRREAAHLGVRDAPKQKIANRGFPKPERPRPEKRALNEIGPSAMQRRFGV